MPKPAPSRTATAAQTPTPAPVAKRPPILVGKSAPPTLWMRPVLWLQRVLQSKIHLRRKGLQVDIRLVSAQAAPQRRRKRLEDQIKSDEDVALEVMRLALSQLMRRHQSSRAVLRHLAFVEQALGQMGMRCFQRLPVPVLSSARRQLEVLVSDWSSRGLSELRSRMAIACAERADEQPAEDGGLGASFGAGRVEVSEASDSVFMQFHAEWTATAPLDPAMVAAALAERDALQAAKSAVPA